MDCGDGIENDVLYTEPSPEEIFLRKASLEQIQDALDHLPPIQARRVYAHYILGLKKSEIARAEGVNSGGICDSVKKGVKNLRRYFEKKKGSNDWRPPMEKSKDEVQAVREQICQLKNHQKILLNKKSDAERKERTHRLIERGAILESVFPSVIPLSNEKVKAFLSDVSQLPEVRKLLKTEPETGDAG